MNNWKKLFFILLSTTLLCADCNKNITTSPDDEVAIDYSFFVAGHAYGNPITYQHGLHPPFVGFFPFIKDYSGMQFGVLTGDVVPFSTDKYWNAAIADMEKLDMPVYIAAGNHDRSQVFLDRFEQYYFSFQYKKDLFIILSPTNWNIEGEQKDFLMNTINNAHSYVKNIFIFSHELIWWSPENAYKNIEINYRPHYPGSNNFWNEIEPYLKSIPNDVIIFAGDMGATTAVSPYMYHAYDNLTFIGSGMGSGEKDNIVIVEILSDGKINYNLIHLNGDDPYDLENLEDYLLP